MYHTQALINLLKKEKLKNIKRNVVSSVLDSPGIVLNKEGNRLALVHQNIASTYSGHIFIYHYFNNIWILEYKLKAIELIANNENRTDFIENEQYIFNLDIWFHPDEKPGFTIKIGNLTNNRLGLTYEFELKDDQYQIASISRNARIQIDNKHFHIEGVF